MPVQTGFTNHASYDHASSSGIASGSGIAGGSSDIVPVIGNPAYFGSPLTSKMTWKQKTPSVMTNPKNVGNNGMYVKTSSFKTPQTSNPKPWRYSPTSSNRKWNRATPLMVASSQIANDDWTNQIQSTSSVIIPVMENLNNPVMGNQKPLGSSGSSTNSNTQWNRADSSLMGNPQMGTNNFMNSSMYRSDRTYASVPQRSAMNSSTSQFQSGMSSHSSMNRRSQHSTDYKDVGYTSGQQQYDNTTGDQYYTGDNYASGAIQQNKPSISQYDNGGYAQGQPGKDLATGDVYFTSGNQTSSGFWKGTPCYNDGRYLPRQQGDNFHTGDQYSASGNGYNDSYYNNVASRQAMNNYAVGNKYFATDNSQAGGSWSGNQPTPRYSNGNNVVGQSGDHLSTKNGNFTQGNQPSCVFQTGGHSNILSKDGGCTSGQPGNDHTMGGRYVTPSNQLSGGFWSGNHSTTR